MNKIQRKRLENLEKLLRDLKYEKNGENIGYYQRRFTHDCGSPACALGHWAAANPKRWTFGGYYRIPIPKKISEEYFSAFDAFEAAAVEFGLSNREAHEIFGPHGCGNARTAKQAADYIKNFLKRKGKEVLEKGNES